MAEQRSCMKCDFSGMDMDLDPYCVHPKVLEEHPYGLVLSSPKMANICPAPEHPLWQIRRSRS